MGQVCSYFLKWAEVHFFQPAESLQSEQYSTEKYSTEKYSTEPYSTEKYFFTIFQCTNSFFLELAEDYIVEAVGLVAVGV